MSINSAYRNQTDETDSAATYKLNVEQCEDLGGGRLIEIYLQICWLTSYISGISDKTYSTTCFTYVLYISIYHFLKIEVSYLDFIKASPDFTLIKIPYTKIITLPSSQFGWFYPPPFVMAMTWMVDHWSANRDLQISHTHRTTHSWHINEWFGFEFGIRKRMRMNGLRLLFCKQISAELQICWNFSSDKKERKENKNTFTLESSPNLWYEKHF